MLKDMLHKGFVLGLVAGIAGFLLSTTNDITAPLIAKTQEAAKVEAEQEVGGTPVEVSVKGYGGLIKLLVGVDEKGKVTGVKVLAMTETPGLGTLASSPAKLSGQSFSFLEQFIGKTVTNKLKAKSDIVSLTGATITSQAISDGVKEALIRNQVIPSINVTGATKAVSPNLKTL